MTKTKILLVDDKAENLLALESLIASADVEILKALSANDALALLLEHDVALALLDVQMPEVNGFELAGLMRSAERSRGIPIIFVTASESEPRQIFEGYERGAVDYLLKPLNAHIVRSKIRVFVDLDQKSKILQQKLQEVEALREMAEDANRAKSRFLANMSHEIRTPLGAVLGFAELLRVERQSVRDREDCITAIMRNGQLLLRLVDEVLDLAKIEAERVEIERVSVALADLITDLRVVHSHIAAEKGIDLEFRACGALPWHVTTDGLRLKQILNNIIGNAIKFTDRGRVLVTASFDQSRREGKLVFLVKDMGCGLTPAEAGRLFQPFMQADGSTKRKYGGTGLGLVISKQLAQLLGGDVTLLESEPGKGSTFVVAIDPGKVQESDLVSGSAMFSHKRPNSQAMERNRRLDGVRVLVADDAKDNRYLISRILAMTGAMVETADDGAEAVEKALSQNFDVILMDIQMPGTDGYEATSQLRSSGYKKPIIALTAHAMKEDFLRCIAAGCNDHLSKPVDHRMLVDSIVGFVEGASGCSHDGARINL